MRSSVTISLVPEVRGGPFVFWDDLAGSIAHARTLGFDAVEIFPPNAEALDVSAIKSYGMPVSAIGTGAGWVLRKLSLSSPSTEARDHAIAFVDAILTKASELGAAAIIGSMQGRWGDGTTEAEGTEILLESLEKLGGRAESLGTTLLYEPLNRYETNFAKTMSAGVKLIAELETDNVKLLADLFHMNIEEESIPRAIREAGDTIGHVHFVDSNRRPAGYGHIDYAPIAEALREIGYTGYLSAEAFAYPDSLTAAKQTMEAFRKL